MQGLAKRVKARILQASTSEVYGNPTVHPQPESYWGNVNPIGIRSCYDEGKCVAETLFFDYRFRHVSSDWDHMLTFMEEHHKEKMDAVHKCFDDTYYYPCNMFVMRREVFEEYCSWLFPILFYVMEKAGSRDDVYQNRYPAFMAERLLTLFCYINRDKYRIVSVDKNFLE